jgi:NAD+ synthetase
MKPMTTTSSEKPRLRVALVQLNPTIGDFNGNLQMIRDSFGRAREAGAELVVYSELTIPGYPPKDLLEREGFVSANLVALSQLAPTLRGAVAVVGFVDRPLEPTAVGRRLRNAAAVIADGQVVSVHHKALLPTYDVFDEGRWFEPAHQVTVARACGRTLGISICEDIWNDPDFWPHRLYAHDPIAELVGQGAEVLINISASPFDLGKRHLRPRMLAAQARKHHRPLVFVNQLGGQDELLFDGHSLVINATGEVRAEAREFAEDLLVVDIDVATGEVHPVLPPPSERDHGTDEAAALAALTLGTRDYARRCGFSTAVVGLSGGIDSALVAAVAARALGPAHVWGISMPSRYSSRGSLDDARVLAERLGIHYEVIPIEGPFTAFLETLTPAFRGKAPDTTEENLQARIRGAILMALSNKHGHLVLSTGNKSELAVGYCTLYGDMVGGLAVIADVPKTMVYRLAAEVNREREIIPQATIDKPPSAELRPDQKDQDSLPPYDVLDRLIEAIVERGLDAVALRAEGYDPRLVSEVTRMVRANEYKRRQAAPGLKLTSKAFGAGRRIPVAQGWRG